MAYADTKTYGYTASAATLAAMMTSIIAHFTTAPGRWELTAVAPVAGEALAIRLKTSPNIEIGIRREGTTELVTMMDDGAAITSVGDSSTAATGSAVAFPDSKSLAWPTVSVDFDIIEYDEAVTILFYSAAKSTVPVAIHVGRGIVPLRDSDVALGITGSVNLNGTPGLTSSGGGVGTWFKSSVAADGSRVRVFDSGSVAKFNQAHLPLTVASSSASRGSTSEDGLVQSVRPMLVNAVSVNGSNDLDVGLSMWIGAAPFGTTPAFTTQYPRVRLDSPGGDVEGWAYVKGAATPTGFVVNVERAVNLA